MQEDQSCPQKQAEIKTPFSENEPENKSEKEYLAESRPQSEASSSPSMADNENKKKALLPFFIPRGTVRSFVRLIIENLFHVGLNGLENIPKKGAAILVCNHTDYLDVIIQFAYCARKLNFLAKKELIAFKDTIQQLLFQKGSPLHSPSSSALKSLSSSIEKNLQFLSDYVQAQFIEWGAQPIEREYHKKVSAKEAMQYYQSVEEKMRELLRQGQVVSIFPEGTRTRTGLMGPFKSIAAKLAVQMQVPVIPSGISGAWKFLTLENLLSGRAFRTLVSYNVGKPIPPEEFPKAVESERHEIQEGQQEIHQESHFGEGSSPAAPPNEKKG